MAKRRCLDEGEYSRRTVMNDNAVMAVQVNKCRVMRRGGLCTDGQTYLQGAEYFREF